MSYSNTQSVVAADLNNMVRGLNRDNSTYTVTGTTAETDMAPLSITGGTIGGTGGIHVIATGTITNVGSGAKDIRLYLGATAVATVSRTAANAQDWQIDAWCFNTSSSAQRWKVVYSSADALTLSCDYITSAIDTASTQTLKVTGDLADATDTITQTMFDVFQVQIS
mgnify:CR=1 FL=1